jgi:ERCC4-type nuclease
MEKDINICQICGDVFSGKHVWNSHNIKTEEYLHKFFPRYCKFTKQLIPFKNVEQYLSQDFFDLSIRNKWATQNIEEAKEYFLDLLIKRKVKKNWKYAPGETQLRLSDMPSIVWFEKAFHLSFAEICKKLDFKIKFTNKDKDLEIDWSQQIKIIEDTREQKGFIFPNNVISISRKLNFGDYALESDLKIAIERKGISDFAGTMAAGYERFQKELKRAKKNKGYLVILIENSLNDFKSIEFLPQTRHIQSTYAHLAKRARDLYEEFDCFQMVFANGRKHAAKIAEFVLKLGKKVKKIDLQLLVQSKKI